ncbi:tetratricopeptide repeat protein [candidate division KSB1 bacterium]|nr:tetratricopeptide repeat protein [candidate division KSB1 bacterium]
MKIKAHQNSNSNQAQNAWITIYLKMWKLYLHARRFLIVLLIEFRKSKAFHIIKLYLIYPFSWKQRVALLEFKKRYADAIDLCKKKLLQMKTPGLKLASEIYESLGRNQRNLNQLDDAFSSFLTAQEFNSKSPSLYYEIGLIHFMKRDYTAARRSMETAIKRGYDTASLRIHLGKVYYQMGMYNRAEDCFTRVLNVYPREGSIHFLLGIVYKSKVDYQLAIQAFKKAIEYGSDQKEEHLGLAEIYTRLGYWREAIQEYKQILDFDPENFIAHYFLGRIYEILGFEDNAIHEFIQANKISPDDEDTKQKLTQLLSSPVIKVEY